MNRVAESAKSISFQVDGTVKTNQRHRHGQGRTFTPAKTKMARREVVQAFREELPDWSPWEGPVVMDVVCVHQMPKSGWPGQQCNKKPDLDNVVKLVGDALNAVAYRDDAQICEVRARKRYEERKAGLYVTLTFLPTPEKPRNGREKVSSKLWEIWDWGELVGVITKPTSTTYCAEVIEDGYRQGVLGDFGTIAEAQAAIQGAVCS